MTADIHDFSSKLGLYFCRGDTFSTCSDEPIYLMSSIRSRVAMAASKKLVTIDVCNCVRAFYFVLKTNFSSREL